MLHFWDAIQTPHYEVQTFLVCTSSLTPQSPTLHCLKQLVLPQPVAPLALPRISPSGPLSPSHLRNCQLSRPGSVPSCLSHESKVSGSRSPWLCGFIFLFINSIHTKREPTRCPALGPLRSQDEFRCPSFQGNPIIFQRDCMCVIEDHALWERWAAVLPEPSLGKEPVTNT